MKTPMTHSVSDPTRFPPERSLRSAVKTWSDSDESDAEAALGDDSERLWNFDLPQVGGMMYSTYGEVSHVKLKNIEIYEI